MVKNNCCIVSTESKLIGIGTKNLTKDYDEVGVYMPFKVAGQLIFHHIDYTPRPIGYNIKIQQQILNNFEGKLFDRLLSITQREISLDYADLEWILKFDIIPRETDIHGFYNPNKEIVDLMKKLFEKVDSKPKPFEMRIKCDYRGEYKNKKDEFSWIQGDTTEGLKYVRHLRRFETSSEILKALEFILERWSD